MKKWRRYLSIALGILVLTNAVPVYGTEINTAEVDAVEDSVGDDIYIDEEEDWEDDGHDDWEDDWYDEEDDWEDDWYDDWYDEEDTPWYSYLSVYAEQYNLNVGETCKLYVYTDAPAEEVVFESKNPSAATVSKDGVVKAVSGGKKGSQQVEIKASWTNPENENNTLSASAYITIQNTITLNKTSYTIYTGQKNTTYKLKATASPKGTVTWKSSNKKVATVDKNGKITPKKKGTVDITATANGVSATCQVTVKKPSLQLPSQATFYIKNPQKLEATVSPKGTIKWKSSNTKIAKVNQKGVVTGLRKGTVTIRATAHGVTKKCKVTIQEPSITVSGYNSANFFSRDAYTVLYAGSTIPLTAVATPAVTVKWKSSNKKVAKVDAKGNVKAVAPGEATITASIGGAKAKWLVKVIKNNYKLSFTKRTLMTGGTTTLSVKNSEDRLYWNFNEESFQTDYGMIYRGLNLSYNGNTCVIDAPTKGKGIIGVSAYIYDYKQGYTAVWNQKCTITVKDTGISAQNFSIAKGTKKALSLLNVTIDENVKSVKWTSSAPKVASVNATTGVVTGKKEGSAKIKATITYINGKKKTYTINMKVSNPKIKDSTVAVALYGSKKIDIKGTNVYSNITWSSSKESVVSVSSAGILTPRQKGSATIKAKVDGKTLKFKVYVSNPQLANSYSLLGVNHTAQINVTGLSKKSDVTYLSSNVNVASVTKNGLITANGGGRAEITVNADGREFTYVVECASQTAINACNNGKWIIDHSSYSQTYRMSEGYYDCSSLVFKAYGYDSALLGGSKSWAPTAAGMATHMVNTQKVIAWNALPLADLRPGDLIFYGKENNGRYLGIYHVSMYYGDGWRLESPLMSYWERDNIVMIARPAP